MPRYCVYCLALTLAALMVGEARAGIALSASRLVYHADDPEISLMVRNENSHDILLQSWLEPFDPAARNVPLAITPPLAHMNGDARQLLRIIYAGSGFADDRESVAWLNVQEIPQSSGDANTLQIAIRQRIKVFFRPRGLTVPVADAPGLLQWRLIDGGHSVQVYNPGPYHVSMAGFQLASAAPQPPNTTTLVTRNDMVGPGQTHRYVIQGTAPAAPAIFDFICIDDYGARQPYRASLSANPSSRAVAVH